uniref:SEC7 domain-containing protein n=1 Tax=Trypanosoma congolense (strain IL3000) TaxID=1068625 RepID=G0UL52_TRYCI|nr:conserved hypothetical protein [Trypanosoma congolense IL3000]
MGEAFLNGSRSMPQSVEPDGLGLDVVASDYSAERWGEDRLVIATQVQNLQVTIRSTERFGAKARFLGSSDVVEHPLLRQLRELERKIMVPSLVRPVEEEMILQPFCDIWMSEEMSETVIGVAMMSLSNIIDLKCSFITMGGLEKLLLLAQRPVGVSFSDITCEDLLFKKLKMCLSCVRHPRASELPESLFIGVLRRAFIITLCPETSLLLRRFAEEVMKETVTVMYRFIVADDLERTAGGASKVVDDDRLKRRERCSKPPPLTGLPMLRYVCGLITGDLSGEREDESVAGLSLQSGEPSLVAAVQLGGLCLVQCILFVVKDHLCSPRCGDLLFGVRHHLCRALLLAGVSTDNIIILSQIFPTVHAVVKMASHHLLPQVFMFIKVLHLDPLARIGNDLNTSSSVSQHAHSSIPPKQSVSAAQMSVSKMLDLCEKRELILESLVGFCTDASFAAFCYAQYDLSPHFPPLLEQVCTLLVENCFNISNANMPLEEGKNDHGAYTADVEVGTSLTRMDALALEAIKGLLWQTMNSTLHVPVTAQPSLAEAIRSRLAQKRLVLEFASLFRDNAVKCGIPFLLQKAAHVPVGFFKQFNFKKPCVDAPLLAIEEPFGGREVGACLHRLSYMLDKRALGDYLGELGREPPPPDPGSGVESQHALAVWADERRNDHMKPGTQRFHEELLEGFLHEFDFRGKSLLSSIREAAFHMCMPGEAQKIDRVMEAFSKTWLEANRDAEKSINPFRSDNGPFILGFSLIMLNTDQHSGKMMTPMTKEDFRRMHRDSDGGNSLPEDFLNAVFDDIRAHPLTMADMMAAGIRNDVTWALEIRDRGAHGGSNMEPFNTLSMRHYLPDGPTLNASASVQPFIFNMLWMHCLTAFGNTLVVCSKTLSSSSLEPTPAVGTEGGDLTTQLTTPEYAYNCALDGLCLLAKTAKRYCVTPAVDRVLLTILSQLPFDMASVESATLHFAAQPSALLCFEKVIQLVNECTDCVLDAWEKLGHLFANFFLLGLFAKGERTLPQGGAPCAELYVNPGAERDEVKDTESDTGWLSALWRAPSNPNRTRELRQQKGQEVLERVKALLPSMEELLEMIDSLKPPSHERVFSALCGEVKRKLHGATESTLASHLLVFVTEIVVRRTNEDAEMERFTNLCQQLTSHCFAAVNHTKNCDLRCKSVVERGNGAGSGSGYGHPDEVVGSPLTAVDNPTTDVPDDKWLTATRRVVRAVLRAVISFSQGASSRCASLPLFNMLMGASPDVFSVAVAPELSFTLLELAVEAPRYFTLGALPLSVVISALSQISALCSDAVVQERTQQAFSYIVRQMPYDLSGDNDGIVDALVACALESSKPKDVRRYITGTPHSSSIAKFPDECADVETRGTFTDSLAVVCHRLAVEFASGGEAGRSACVPQAWATALDGLSTLVVESHQNRHRITALLCLQRCLLDLEIELFSEDALMQVYERAIFLLMEKVCALSLDSPATQGHGDTQESVDQVRNPADEIGSTGLPRQFSVTSILSSLAPAPPPRRALRSGIANGSLKDANNRRREVLDLRCRVVSLLSSVFLHHAGLLEEPVVLRRLWQRVLESLSAFYSSVSVRPAESTINGQVNSDGASKEDVMTEEVAVLREAIQESIKNMIHVLVTLTMEPESAMASGDMSLFWATTKSSLSSFDFVQQLLDYIDTIEEK